MGLRKDAEGASAPFGFAIAGAILLLIIGALLLTGQQAGLERTSSDEQNLRQEAESIADLVVDSKGAGWESGADSLTQMGLLKQNGSGIDLARMAAFKGAVFDASNNGKVDYNESMLLLGLDPDGTKQFHIRIAPVALNQALATNLGGIKTMYIGDWKSSVDMDPVVALDTDENMAADARGQIGADIETVAITERSAIDTLGLDFDDRIHILNAGVEGGLPPLPGTPIEALVTDPTDLLSGDVYPDQKQYLDFQIPARINDYKVLVVGSNVDHSALTSNAVKSTIEAWVISGGTLIVFGSDSQSFQWLESLMGVGIETANGGAFAPDVDHPVLREPHALDWPAYSNFGQAWGGKQGGGNNNFDDQFQHVIQGDDGDVLAISKDGAYGTGRVFLSTYRPADIANEISLQESMNLVNNLVVYSDRQHLFLDYGPAPPQDASVGAAYRTSHVWDPDFGQIPVRVSVLVWG